MGKSSQEGMDWEGGFFFICSSPEIAYFGGL